MKSALKVLACSAAGWVFSAACLAGEVQVAVAANFAAPIKAVAAVLEKTTGHTLRLTLGASGKLLAQVQRAELLGVGALAGVLASLAASAIGWVLANQVFGFSWNPSPLVPLFGGVAGALLSLAAGWWGLRDVLRRPVVETLRQAAQ